MKLLLFCIILLVEKRFYESFYDECCLMFYRNSAMNHGFNLAKTIE